MQAIVYRGPGSLELAEWPEPSARDGEVLVEVSHVGICGSDLLLWEGGFPTVVAPVVLGHEIAGRIADPNGAEGLAAGDPVAVEPLITCGACRPCRDGAYNACRALRLIGADADGGAARLVAVPADRAHRVPDRLPLRAAALAEPLAVAIHMTRRAEVGLGDTVLILGGGPIGALIAFVCRRAGAAAVVVSEPNAQRRETLRALGLRAEDLSASADDCLEEITGGEGFDVVFEVAAVPATLRQATSLARIHGTILLGGLPGGPLPLDVTAAALREQRILGSRVYRSGDVRDALAMLEAGDVPVDTFITKEVALEDAISEGFEHLRDALDEMKIVVTP